MAIDTYLIQNGMLRTLELKDVYMTQDMLRLLGGTIETSTSLLMVDFSQNMLRNGGAREAAKIICRNKFMQHLDISQN